MALSANCVSGCFIGESPSAAHQNASGNILRADDLPRWTFKDRPSLDWQPDGESPVGTPAGALAAERSRILETLTQNRWNRKRTARDLGMDRTTLWRWMKRLGIHPWHKEIGEHGKS